MNRIKTVFAALICAFAITSCSNKIMENIAFEKGIKDLKVSVPEKKITVKYDASKTNEEAILEAFRKIGYPAVVVERK